MCRSGVTLFNRELHVGGYYSWTGQYGDLSNGFSESTLDVNWVNEIHGRVVLDFLKKLWKVKWLGLGGSYFWGEQFHWLERRYGRRVQVLNAAAAAWRWFSSPALC